MAKIIYLAGEFSDNDHDLIPMRRRLFSYYYHHEGDQPSAQVIAAHEKHGMDLFLDSGAFTACTQNVDIRVEDYAAFYHNVRHRFTTCASLDVIGSAEKSYNNLKALESLGCQVVPVFHCREDARWLVKYLDQGYDYICLGGMVGESAPWLRAWLDWLYAKYLTKADGAPRVRVHGFGMTSPSLVRRYRWYSVDSSSWLNVGMFGACVFMNRRRHLDRIHFSLRSPTAKQLATRHYLNLHPVERQHIDARLMSYGVTAAQCIEETKGYIFRHMVNAQTYQEMEAA